MQQLIPTSAETRQCFPPLYREDARVLILGSMPGARSLAAGEYYAHPQNAFWPIMGALYGAQPQLNYRLRCQRLITHQIAVWDVLKACEREGSLDASIRASSMVPNDFSWLFERCKELRCILFNGAKAEDVFRRKVLPNQPGFSLRMQRLPSTSPAYASLNRQQKLEIWKVALTSR